MRGGVCANSDGAATSANVVQNATVRRIPVCFANEAILAAGLSEVNIKILERMCGGCNRVPSAAESTAQECAQIDMGSFAWGG